VITTNNIQSTANSTLNYTPANVTDSCLVVFVSSEDVDNNQPITAVKFGSTEMVLEVIGNGVLNVNSNDVAIAYLINCGTTAQTISVTGGERLGISALTLDNVKQTGSVDVSDGTATSTAVAVVTTTATTSNADSFVVSACVTGDPSANLSVSGGTEILEFTPPSSKMALGTSTQSSAGTYSHEWTSSISGRTAAASIAFNKAVSGVINIDPTAIASAESFGTPTIATGVVLIDPVAITTQESVGNPTISLGGIVIAPSAIPSQEFVGQPVITTQGVVIQPVVISTEEAVGAPTLVTGVVIVIPDGIPTEEAVGDPVIQLLLQQIFPDEILTEEFVGQPAVFGGAVIAIPVRSRQTWNAVAKYLRGLVFKGSDNDVIVAWLRSEGLEEGEYNDLWYNYLLQNGFLDGSLTDKYAAWRQNLAGDDPWLLSDGNWDDTKIWIDNETWRDN
jgi:hypothetical protein